MRRSDPQGLIAAAAAAPNQGKHAPVPIQPDARIRPKAGVRDRARGRLLSSWHRFRPGDCLADAASVQYGGTSAAVGVDLSGTSAPPE
jgi:hypothetical protein